MFFFSHVFVFVVCGLFSFMLFCFILIEIFHFLFKQFVIIYLFIYLNIYLLFFNFNFLKSNHNPDYNHSGCYFAG